MSKARKTKKVVKRVQTTRLMDYTNVFDIVRDAMLETVQATLSGNTSNLAEVAQKATEKILSL